MYLIAIPIGGCCQGVGSRFHSGRGETSMPPVPLIMDGDDAV